MDYDGSGVKDKFEIVDEFLNLEDAKQKFKDLTAELDTRNIKKSASINTSSKEGEVETLFSEYREIEIYPFWEKEWVALEIIKTSKKREELAIDNGVKNFGGCVYS